MTKKEYAEYEAAVAAFFEREKIDYLYVGHPTCPECSAEWTDGPDSYDTCPNGHGHRDGWNEPFFSWRRCDCCGSHLGGNREHAVGVKFGSDEEQPEYTICEDCVYYNEYGCLDDTTMMEIEQSEE